MEAVSPKLVELRKLMAEHKLNAYIIPHNDAHSSEYIAECDERIKFISGFSGSAGIAVVTEKEALLWTDGRYFLQATKQLLPGWKLMKIISGERNSDFKFWLSENLAQSSHVGLDPLLFDIKRVSLIKGALQAKQIELALVSEDLVDKMWKDRPAPSKKAVMVHDVQYAGEEASDKLKKVFAVISKRRCDAGIVSALDQIAWMLNLRGADINFNPYFVSYLVIVLNGSAAEVTLYSDMEKFKDEKVVSHLAKIDVKLRPYEAIMTEIAKLTNRTIGIELMTVNEKIYSQLLATKSKVLDLSDDIPMLKLKKNPVELDGFRKCHVRDGAGLVKYLAWLENQLNVQKRTDLTEYMAAEKVLEFRSMQDKFMGLSFDTISSIGPNGSIVHYKPEKEGCAIVNNKEIYLLDSGAHYLDGTTDVTRTIHCGVPKEYEKEMYTRVLMGNLELERAVFPNKKIVDGAMLDMYSRKYLWQVGKDFNHGTGHGVGHFSGVHEGPIGISLYRKLAFEEGYNCTNEPGYYEDNQFGIRIENLMLCVKSEQHKDFLCFENITMAPYCKALIKWDLMSKVDIEQVNQYHKKVYETLKPLMKDDEIALKYLERECEPYKG